MKLLTTSFTVVVVLVSLGVVNTNAQTVGLTDEEKEEVVRAHNYYRGLVDPVAANMEKMVWDDELGYMSQFWAANCIYEANEQRHTQSTKYDYVGHNMIALSGYSANYTMLVNRWFRIGQNYDFSTKYCRDEDGNQEQCENEEECVCAPYVQLVWANTYAVGCGSMRCQELEGAEDGENAFFFVCNYGPGGSIASQEDPYQKGEKSCSACPSDKPYCVKNLCSESGADRMVAQMSMVGILIAAIASML